ncbi:MAG: DEAD/DEAH box helicase [Bryobacterales bacterium]|nr:DEAD/DEAH box helicase [Bryobacterales bacterium]
MSLTSKLAFQVPKQVQLRGYEIFRAGGVRVAEATLNSFLADVRGTSLYRVEMVFADREVEVFCTCPAFEKYGPCKHAWAAILEADRRGSLSEARSAPSLTLIDALDIGNLGELDHPGGNEARDFFFTSPPRLVPPKAPPVPLWREQIETITRLSREQTITKNRNTWPKGFEVAYVIDVTSSRRTGTVVLNLQSRNLKKNGDWSVFKDLRLGAGQASQLPNPQDAELVSLLLGGQSPYTYSSSHYTGTTGEFALPIHLLLRTLPQMAQLGRLWAWPESRMSDPIQVAWDDGEGWRFWACIQRNERDLWELTGELRRQGTRIALDAPQLLLPAGLLMHHNTLARFEDTAVLPWIQHLTSAKAIRFPDSERDQVLVTLLGAPMVPLLDIDSELQFEQRQAQPRFGLRLKESKNSVEKETLEATLLADYGVGFEPVSRDGPQGFWLAEERVYVLRDQPSETVAWQTLEHLGIRLPTDGSSPGRLAAKSMPKVVRELVTQGWHVEAQGSSFRKPGLTQLAVSSGIDWFELHGGVDFEGQLAALPQLLAAARRGDGMVRLGDGSYGMLPEDWLQRFAPLAGLGEASGDHLRFRANQAALLDALLAAQPEVRVDEVFQRARDRMTNFQGIQPAKQPLGFKGKLRQYQLEGLGWIEFLRDYGFGGILADDMGVGKTAQVLAALEQRRTGKHGTSLVVAPRSLLFNWRQEAERFTPKLKVLEHSGLARDFNLIDRHDLVLTTYGTLQRDIHQLSKHQFDYVVLDEAQAIKNASTISAKAVRLLKGTHRLALSGTPVENHLGELWSLFEFLNPGMLGEAKVLKLSGGLARNPSEETRRLLATALRPFILRRTKQQVARELPEKTEQTVYCELEGDQRLKYNQLRDHYRASLLGKPSGSSQWNKMKIQVLEALLRLRQAACHPGLIDPALAAEPSAKFSTLMDQLEELRGEGHKALVFSQFTSLLALLRQRLDNAGFRYEYLDGQTRDRQACVEHFQNDEQCQLFLISLRAGGLGLNLTSAGYVFLLDPWWNPAVEAQAIDRAHRIGQTKNVFAYRLIARDTVEEKVLELQKSKRALADAILTEDNSLLRDMRREDLELLLS